MRGGHSDEMPVHMGVYDLAGRRGLVGRRLNEHDVGVALDRDLSAHGIRSILTSSPASVQRVLDHLVELGHRTIDCFVGGYECPDLDERVAQWADAYAFLLNELGVTK